MLPGAGGAGEGKVGCGLVPLPFTPGVGDACEAPASLLGGVGDRDGDGDGDGEFLSLRLLGPGFGLTPVCLNFVTLIPGISL